VAKVVKEDLAAAMAEGLGDQGVDAVTFSLGGAAKVQVRTSN